jgi:hypothetical protein
LPFLHQKYKYSPKYKYSEKARWVVKRAKFERNGQKKALYSPIGSKGVKNREKWNKIGLK